MASLYAAVENSRANDLQKKGLEPFPCDNAVCKDNGYEEKRGSFCKKGASCHGCLFQMLDAPPNSLNYSGYMPTHQEALDMLENRGILSGEKERYKKESLHYQQAMPQGNRHNYEIKNIKMFHIRMAVEQTLKSFHDNEYADIDFNDPDEWNLLSHDVCLEVEKAMGVYPNIHI